MWTVGVDHSSVCVKEIVDSLLGFLRIHFIESVVLRTVIHLVQIEVIVESLTHSLATILVAFLVGQEKQVNCQLFKAGFGLHISFHAIGVHLEFSGNEGVAKVSLRELAITSRSSPALCTISRR